MTVDEALDALPRPVWLVGADGEVLARNRLAGDRLPPTAGTAVPDPCVGLPPVAEWRDAARRIARFDGTVTCALIGIVGLDSVNDDLSRSMGDLVLGTVHDRLRATWPRAVVERVAPDCFALVGPCSDLGDDVGDVLAVLVRRPIDVPLGRVAIGSSIGLAQGAAATGMVLLDRAQRSLRLALRRGSGTVVQEPPERPAPVRKVTEVAGALVDAVADGLIGAHFQPVIDLWTGEVVEYEALARWTQNPEESLEATSFMGAASLTGVIASIGEGVLGEAIALGAALDHEGTGTAPRVSVNVTVRELLDISLPEHLGEVLPRCAAGSGGFQLEVPALVEPELVDDVAARLAEVRALGVRVAIDGFGGPQSFTWLLRAVEVDAVKLAAQLLDGVGTDERAERYFWSLLGMARDAGVEAIAKGVETELQHKALRRLGCRYAQGHHYGLPQPVQRLGVERQAARLR